MTSSPTRTPIKIAIPLVEALKIEMQRFAAELAEAGRKVRERK
jgi:hypothetical protein